MLGRKVYARDFRARDMDGWPGTERAAMVLYASCVDRPFLGVDLSVLPDDLQPMTTVDAERIAEDSIGSLFPDTAPEHWAVKSFFAEKGKMPGYFGQPLAILIFKDAATFRAAHRKLQFRDDVIRFGDAGTPEPATGIYPSGTYLTYEEGEGGFSQTKDGRTNPHEPDGSKANRRARDVRAEIDRKAESSGWRNYSGKRSTQRIVPMFMEPESGLAWLNGRKLHLVLGTQSPNGDVQDGLTLLQKSSFKVDHVDLVSCYPGGGFGGRDVSPFTPTLMLAAAYADGPVRISHDRFAQFQVGLTQLPAAIDQTLSVDDDGMFQALRVESRLPAGGRNNYSQFVASLAGVSAAGAYHLPRGFVDAMATPTHNLIAGSMRGFGGVQAAFALETLVDEVARDRGEDPIAFRRKNVLRPTSRTLTGAPMTEPTQVAEICERAAKHPLWVGREAMQAEQRRKGKLYGVGFALANQAFGVGNDGVLGDVEIERDGSIVVRTTAVDMGQGSATSLALATARWLGANAKTIEMGRVGIFDHLELVDTQPDKSAAHHAVKGGTSHSPNKWQANPRYTASVSMSSSACITAFQQFHAIEQSARALFEFGLWPAAVDLWGSDPGSHAKDSATWVEGALVVEGLPPLALAVLAARLHDRAGVCEAMIHAYYAGRWVRATYTVAGFTAELPIDALATRTGSMPKGSYALCDRQNVVAPPPDSGNYSRSLYTPSGSLVALTVDPQSGEVELRDIHTYLDAGIIHQKQLVEGQYHGGVAMGVGYALMENAPSGAGGPGGGRWNLNRYHVPLARDIPLRRTRLELLEPVGRDPKAKGVGEAVLCPIPPAIANAMTDATGHVFQNLPITRERILEVLHR